VNYFLSTKSMGSHNIVAGYDDFHELRHENNFQSGSDFRIWGDFIVSGSDVFFHVKPEDKYFVEWTPINTLSQTSDASVKSLYVNDKWDYNSRLSFNVGVRYDKNDAVDQSHNKTSDDSAFSPRLGVVFDVKGDGRNRITANYAKYVSHIDNGVNDSIASGGTPGSIYYNYRGPEINGGSGPYIPTDQVIKQVFDWFNSVGGTNYTNINSILLPGYTAKLRGQLKSPNAQEYSLGYGRQLGATGFLRLDYIHRTWSDFYVSFTDTTIAHNTTPNGTVVDVSQIGNDNSGLERRYNGLQTQASYRIGRVNLGGNYTFSKTRGNVEGETFNNATVTVGDNDYPEYKSFAQFQPVGYLAEDIRHRLNLFTNYDQRLPWGSLNIGVLQRYHSGAPYSAVGSARMVGFVTNPNGFYKTPPTNATYFYSGRGAFRVDNISSTDFSATYNLPTFGRVNVFVRGDLVNAFNQQGIEFASTGLGAVVESRVYSRATTPRTALGTGGLVRGTNTPFCLDGTGARLANQAPGQANGNCNPFAAFNPFTETPKVYHKGDDPDKVYNYMLDPTFGQATNKDAYQLPRTYRFAVGLRF